MGNVFDGVLVMRGMYASLINKVSCEMWNPFVCEPMLCCDPFGLVESRHDNNRELLQIKREGIVPMLRKGVQFNHQPQTAPYLHPYQHQQHLLYSPPYSLHPFHHPHPHPHQNCDHQVPHH